LLLAKRHWPILRDTKPSTAARGGATVKLKRIIAKLEKQQRDLNETIVALRQMAAIGSLRVDHEAISLDEFEKRLVAEALERAGGNQTKAAHILQVSRDKVRYKMAKHGLKGTKPITGPATDSTTR
jgi:DNA-binding NtrC family response regulator